VLIVINYYGVVVKKYDGIVRLMVAGFLLVGFVFECSGMDLVGKDDVNEVFGKLCRASKESNLTFKGLGHNHIEVLGNSIAATKKSIVQHAQSVNVGISPKLAEGLLNFATYMCEQGSHEEKEIYKNIALPNLVHRYFSCRPLAAYGIRDLKTGEYLKEQFLFRDNTMSLVLKGKPMPAHITLTDYISPDEIMWSSLLSLSSWTCCINSGSRKNVGHPNQGGVPYKKEIVFVGVVGPRFEVSNEFDWKLMVITKDQNTAQNGYGVSHCNNGALGIWEKFYNTKFPTYEEAETHRKEHANEQRFVPVGNPTDNYLFNVPVYKQRVEIAAESFFTDGSARASTAGTLAYLHVVGLGIGLWAIDKKKQEQWMLEKYAHMIRNNKYRAKGIGAINFSWFDPSEEIKKELIQIGLDNDIVIWFSKKDPAAQDPIDKADLGEELFNEWMNRLERLGSSLPSYLKGMITVAMYAWDGNAYPGNEYWLGALDSSGDPAAACCSTITQTQNILVNPFLSENIRNQALWLQDNDQEVGAALKKLRETQSRMERAALPTDPAGPTSLDIQVNLTEKGASSPQVLLLMIVMAW
jgi:Domain of unknown function (DUF4804)